MIVEESEGINFYQDIHGRVKMPGGFNLSLSQKEPPTFESFTNERYEQMNLNFKFVPHKINPVVCLEDGSIKVKSERLEIGTRYEIFLDDKKYLILKSKEGVIDLYESTD